jgi:DNA-binding NarL/FixJ family response regulator/HPt (histidine-containing phosphotransfer) domain-containing protein
VKVRRASPASSPDALQQALDEARRRFVDTFDAQCNSIGILADQALSGQAGPVLALTQVVHKLTGLAGTIGFPTISARASELEQLARGGSRRGAFDSVRAGWAVEAIRRAFAKDLASPPARPTTPVPKAGAGTLRIAEADSIPTVRVLIVDDHTIVRCGLRAMLANEFSGAAFGEAADARQAFEQLRKAPWDIALLDITLPGKSGLDLLKELKAEWPTLPVLVLSGHPEDQFAVRVLKAGAGGYLTKESAPEELAKAIHKILAGGRYVSPALAEKLALDVGTDSARTPHEMLSDREYAVMALIGSGKTVKEIGAELSLSAKTISTYRARVLEKLSVKNSAEIVQYAIRNGLVT